MSMSLSVWSHYGDADDDEDYKQLDTNEKEWSLGFLKCTFKNRDLEALYQDYQLRLQYSQFIVYLVLQTFVSILTALTSITWFAVTGTEKDSVVEVLPVDFFGNFLLASVCIGMLVYFRDESKFQKNRIMRIVSSILCLFILEMLQLGVSLMKGNRLDTRTAEYDWNFYILIVVYVFFPFRKKLHAFTAGFLVTISQLLMIALDFYLDDDAIQIERMAGDAFVLLGGNVMGVYFRYVNETIARHSFFDKRASVGAKLKLKYEQEQEENLLQSILPKYLADKVIGEGRRDAVFNGGNNKDFWDLHIVPFKNVTILFADIVNFTPLTKKLEVHELVRMLNDLFERFDQLAKMNDCLRIKILGDCYYCVSGIPNPTEKHSINCVKMGLGMIHVIHTVRADSRSPEVRNVDMRIGVHSGDVFSGVMGRVKLQFDIWSQDVNIANHMEQAGSPGCVHLTEATIRSLGELQRSRLNYHEGKSDDYLKHKKVNSYLLPLEDNLHLLPENIHMATAELRSVASPEAMTDTIGKFQNMLRQGNAAVEKAIQEMPLGIFSEWFHPSGINPIFLTYPTLQKELSYISSPDPLLKLSLAAAFGVVITMGIVQAFTVVNGSVAIALSTVPTIACALSDTKPCPFQQYVARDHLLAMTVIFVFYRFHLLFKLSLMVIDTIIFILIIFGNVWSGSELREDYYLQNIHFFFLALVTFHVIDRQSEYLSRMDYNWRVSQMKEHEEANKILNKNRELLRSILPENVANFYLDSTKATELYHERYYSVAVMFATIPNFKPKFDRPDEMENSLISSQEEWAKNAIDNSGVQDLKILNIILTKFDEVLATRFKMVEKIKLVGTTYMAAMGLQTAETYKPEFADEDPSENPIAIKNATVLVDFAVELMDVLKQTNRSMQSNYKLRIGIACGPLMAGVIGTTKPFYDIWGDTVNMASRLDYTGAPDNIHIREDVHSMLRAKGITCQSRGLTKIKGVDLPVQTYFVDIESVRRCRDDLDYQRDALPSLPRRKMPDMAKNMRMISDPGSAILGRCGFPGSPAHSIVTFSPEGEIRTGTVATYSCDWGFELLGTSTRRVCSENGTWVPDGIPFCATKFSKEYSDDKGDLNAVNHNSLQYLKGEVNKVVLNVAAGKAPMQSTVAEAGRPHKAVDGSTSTRYDPETCTLTQPEPAPWWYINLLEPYLVQVVRIDFGMACCGDNPVTIVVRVGNNKPTLRANPICNKFSGVLQEGRQLYLPCNLPMEGAFVSIHLEGAPGQQLSICETFVYTDLALPIERCPSFRDQPPGSTATYNGTCYTFYNRQPMSFDEAQQFCADRGGSLIDKANPALQGFFSWELFRRHRADPRGQYWMGARRDPTNPRNWLWISGKDVTISFWNLPGGNGDCARFDGTQRWLWADTNCRSKLNFICQHEPLGCGRPEQPPNSTILAQNFDVGSKVEYRCDAGHLLVGPVQRVCLRSGFYNEFPPTCRYIECGLPAPIPHGNYELVNGSRTYLNMVVYRCDEGFNLVGRAELTCDVDRRWNGPPPRCEPVYCPQPPTIRHGSFRLSTNSTVLGTVVQYYCRSDRYTLVGPNKIVCGKDGIYDQRPPTCRENPKKEEILESVVRRPRPTRRPRPVKPDEEDYSLAREDTDVDSPLEELPTIPDSPAPLPPIDEGYPQKPIDNEIPDSVNIRSDQHPGIDVPSSSQEEASVGIAGPNSEIIIALGIFGGIVFLAVVITIIVILVRRNQNSRPRRHRGSRDSDTVSSFDSTGSEGRGLSKYYKRAWEDLGASSSKAGMSNSGVNKHQVAGRRETLDVPAGYSREGMRGDGEIVVSDVFKQEKKRHHHHHHHHKHHPPPSSRY
ncbi:unnamed protein product [Cyprideis torosa]|uniref:adenylate cyclase n=1 Tax=Cyprideis torosa TaxID=163714 RepID=A0A7R8W4U4_9CRUS|nr:unnamed protein product [Cyprideis torosa]CAG0879193.1 unnamed protein product [Cyprideis torosa]